MPFLQASEASRSLEMGWVKCGISSGGWTEGHKKFALEAHSKRQSGWREKDKLVGMSSKLPRN